MKKLTNVQKILKALKSGPKTQVDLVRETKVKNVYQIISDLKKKKLVFMDTGKCVHLAIAPIATESLNDKGKRQATGGRTTHKPESEIITTLRGEVENIQDGIRSLMMARSYLLRRIEEEKRNA
jgi:hypothetical protein